MQMKHEYSKVKKTFAIQPTGFPNFKCAEGKMSILDFINKLTRLVNCLMTKFPTSKSKYPNIMAIINYFVTPRNNICIVLCYLRHATCSR